MIQARLTERQQLKLLGVTEDLESPSGSKRASAARKSDEDDKQIQIEEIDENFQGLHRGQEPLERCLWFDSATRKCRHYQWRPQVCRDYELGGDACLATREKGGLMQIAE